MPKMQTQDASGLVDDSLLGEYTLLPRFLAIRLPEYRSVTSRNHNRERCFAARVNLPWT